MLASHQSSCLSDAVVRQATHGIARHDLTAFHRLTLLNSTKNFAIRLKTESQNLSSTYQNHSALSLDANHFVPLKANNRSVRAASRNSRPTKKWHANSGAGFAINLNTAAPCLLFEKR